MDIVRCCVAFVVPPFGLYMQEGLSRRFWIAALLTMLGFLPGMLYAVFTIFQHESQPRFRVLVPAKDAGTAGSSSTEMDLSSTKPGSAAA